MSILLERLNILFCIFVLISLNLTSGASISHKDDTALSVSDQDFEEYYWDSEEPISNELTNNGDNYSKKCKPIKRSTTTDSPPSTSSTTSLPTTSEGPIGKVEAEDVVEHVINILRSMRQHATALIRDMNDLEMDMLSSSANLETICENSTTNDSSETVNNGLPRNNYPDVLSQLGGYAVNSIPLEDVQTNDFVAEAKQAVKSWKQQIETCKTILDNAVHNALRKTNLKSSIGRKDLKVVENESNYLGKKGNPSSIGYKELSRDLKQEQEKARNNKIYNYHSLYDAFRRKN